MGRWMSIPISSDTRPWHFWSCNAFENEAHFVLECPLYNPIRDKFPSLLRTWFQEHEVFIQLDQQVNISFYLMEATAFPHAR